MDIKDQSTSIVNCVNALLWH